MSLCHGNSHGPWSMIRCHVRALCICSCLHMILSVCVLRRRSPLVQVCLNDRHCIALLLEHTVIDRLQHWLMPGARSVSDLQKGLRSESTNGLCDMLISSKLSTTRSDRVTNYAFKATKVGGGSSSASSTNNRSLSLAHTQSSKQAREAEKGQTANDHGCAPRDMQNQYGMLNTGASRPCSLFTLFRLLPSALT